MANSFNFIDDATLDGVLWKHGILESPNSSVTIITQIGHLSITGSSSSDNKTLNTQLNNTGTISHSSVLSAELFFADGAILNNSGTYNLTAGSIYDDSIGIDNGVFNNSGTLNKNGSGYAFIDVDFNNTGTVNIGLGTLALGDVSVHDHSNFEVAEAGTLNFNAGNHTLKNGATITGNGDVNIFGSLDIQLTGDTSIY